MQKKIEENFLLMNDTLTHNSLGIGGADYLVAKHDIEIRRYLTWRKTVRGKTIPIRLYEIIYVGLVMLWSKMDKPPLKTAIYNFIDRKKYSEQLMSGQLFQKLIDEIKENPNEDGSGYYLSDSGEQLTHEDVEQLEKEAVHFLNLLGNSYHYTYH